MNNAAQEFFFTTVKARQEELKQSVEKLLDTLFSSSPSTARSAAAHETGEVAKGLRGILHEQFRPRWPGSLIDNLHRIENAPDNELGATAARRIASVTLPELSRHTWQFEVSDSSAIDFDAIFETARESNQIPNLFDEVIGFLQRIVDSGHIDSVRLLKELETIIATLKKGRTGSYVATRSSWFFFMSWARETGWEALGEIPVLGAAVRGLRGAMAKTDEAMQKMHNDFSAEAINRVKSDLPQLVYNPPPLPAMLPGPDVIDVEAKSNGEQPTK